MTENGPLTQTIHSWPQCKSDDILSIKPVRLGLLSAPPWILTVEEPNYLFNWFCQEFQEFSNIQTRLEIKAIISCKLVLNNTLWSNT